MIIARFHILLAAVLGLGLAGCEGQTQQNQKGSKAGQDDGDDEEEDEDEDEEGDADAADSAGSAAADFAGWCEKAGETKATKGAMAEFYDKFCPSGKPSTLLKSTLVKNAYKGSGSPKLKSIEPISSDKASKTTTAYYGIGIKLPISIKTHFDKVGPRAGDIEAQKKLIAASGAEVEAFEIKDEYKEDGTYHVRGWKVYSKSVKTVAIIKVVTESMNRSDQFMLEEDNLYMYTQETLEGMQTVKNFDMLTAGIQVGDAGYLLTLVKAKIDNKGQAKIAEGEVEKIAKETIKNMYKASEAAK